MGPYHGSVSTHRRRRSTHTQHAQRQVIISCHKLTYDRGLHVGRLCGACMLHPWLFEAHAHLLFAPSHRQQLCVLPRACTRQYIITPDHSRMEHRWRPQSRAWPCEMWGAGRSRRSHALPPPRPSLRQWKTAWVLCRVHTRCGVCLGEFGWGGEACMYTPLGAHLSMPTSDAPQRR